MMNNLQALMDKFKAERDIMRKGAHNTQSNVLLIGAWAVIRFHRPRMTGFLELVVVTGLDTPAALWYTWRVGPLRQELINEILLTNKEKTRCLSNLGSH